MEWNISKEKYYACALTSKNNLIQNHNNCNNKKLRRKKCKNVTKSNMINKEEVILCHCFCFFVFILSFHWWRRSRSTEFYIECQKPRIKIGLRSCLYAATWELGHYWWSKLSLMIQINPEKNDSKWIVILKWFPICTPNQ